MMDDMMSIVRRSYGFGFVSASIVAGTLLASGGVVRAQSPFQRTPSSSFQQHAMISLVAERTAAVPGQPLAVGLHFEIDPHWHIYWRNPGDSGGPPTIEWKLPPGFEAGGFEWPVPQRIDVGGTLVNYGYEADVLLPLTMRVPASAKPGTSVDLGGRVKYLICSDLCVPARADVSLTVPVAATGGAATSPSPAAPLFAQTRARIPKPAPSSWRTTATLANRQFDLTIDTGTRETGAQFFPLTAGQIDDSAPQQATPTARGIRLTLRASEQLTAAPRTLAGLVVFPDHRAFTIDAPVSGGSE
jgi:DsbC/DsbD-like thiol-disulfide interchange protein